MPERTFYEYQKVSNTSNILKILMNTEWFFYEY